MAQAPDRTSSTVQNYSTQWAVVTYIGFRKYVLPGQFPQVDYWHIGPCSGTIDGFGPRDGVFIKPEDGGDHVRYWNDPKDPLRGLENGVRVSFTIMIHATQQERAVVLINTYERGRSGS
ncbi:hypothetical protein MMC28_004249 [Mycoblastus sanguinarius]|nr:hypothetical protein [Mycoblastus sanguinarius]